MSNMKISNSVEEARLVHLRQVHPQEGNLFVSKMWQFV